MYAEKLPVAEVQKRLDEYYRPYHAALESLVAERAKLFGEVYLIDCHSMPGLMGASIAQRHADFVLGDLDGTSCDPAFTRLVQDCLQEMGYNVALNNPYKGVEILRRYGKPQQGRHALQMEISRRLYVNEQTLEKNDHFFKLHQDFVQIFGSITKQLTRASGLGLAAE